MPITACGILYRLAEDVMAPAGTDAGVGVDVPLLGSSSDAEVDDASGPKIGSVERKKRERKRGPECLPSQKAPPPFSHKMDFFSLHRIAVHVFSQMGGTGPMRGRTQLASGGRKFALLVLHVSYTL